MTSLGLEPSFVGWSDRLSAISNYQSCQTVFSCVQQRTVAVARGRNLARNGEKGWGTAGITGENRGSRDWLGWRGERLE